MDKLDKVIKGLKCHIKGECEIDHKNVCPYWEDDADCSKHAMADAIDLLTEQHELIEQYKSACQTCKSRLDGAKFF